MQLSFIKKNSPQTISKLVLFQNIITSVLCYPTCLENRSVNLQEINKNNILSVQWESAYE